MKKTSKNAKKHNLLEVKFKKGTMCSVTNSIFISLYFGNQMVKNYRDYKFSNAAF